MPRIRASRARRAWRRPCSPWTLITATALVKPSKSVHDVDAKSVMKKMKDKAFAKGVSREDVMTGAQELGVADAMESHIQFVIDAMRRAADAIGLAGQPVA
jgi:predicted hydrolase (HD superfamily)